jgi:hypothetical protein
MPRAWRADRDYDDLDPDDCGHAAFVCLRLNSLSVITFTDSLATAKALAAVPSCGRGCVGAHSVAHRVAGRIRIRTVAQPPSPPDLPPPLPNELLSTAIVLPPPLVPVPRATTTRRTRTKPPATAASTGAASTPGSEATTRTTAADSPRCRYGHRVVEDHQARCRHCRRLRGRLHRGRPQPRKTEGKHHD